MMDYPGRHGVRGGRLSQGGSLISLLDKTRCVFVFVGMFCVHKMNFIY